MIAKNVNTIYNSAHIFTVYIRHGEHSRFLVDTDNNLYTPIYHTPHDNQLTNFFQIMKVLPDHCFVKSSKKNRKYVHPTYKIMHYTGNRNVYLFRCDEYFGNDVHEKIQKLNRKYTPANNGRCEANGTLTANSGNYGNNDIRCCSTKNNLIYQYIDLFKIEQKRMLYRYIYDDSDGGSAGKRNKEYIMRNLGIYYLLIDLKHRMSNRFFVYPTTHNGDEDNNRTNGMKFNENTLKTNLRHIFCMDYGISNKKMLRSSAGNTTGVIANMNELRPIRVDLYGLDISNYMP